MRRREYLLAAAAWTTLRASVSSAAEPRDLARPHAFTVDVDAAQAGTPVNRMLLGQNVQWTHGGDGMLDRSGQWRPAMLEKFHALHPTSLRFPGGNQSDCYRWKHAMGPLETRKENLHFVSRQPQPSIMGTQELLELCELSGAQPLFTVNTVTGTPEEAADWLRLTNRAGLVSRRTGMRLPKVPFWEIGNEPYLKEGDASQHLAPAVYMERANAFIRALRAVDPGIRIGVPLRTAKVAGLPATPYPEFAHDVLTRVVEPFDFISNHNAYMPYLFDKVPDDRSLYWGTMGAAATVAQNLDETAALSRALRPGWTPAQAITEYNALFSLGKGESDNYIASHLGALYVADILRTFAERSDIVLAQYWSLSGNWKFGAIAEAGYERPGYHVLRMADEVLHGARLAATMRCGTFDAPRVGAAAEAKGLPLVTSLATREAGMLRIMLINKDIDRSATGEVRIAGGVASGVTVAHLTSDSVIRAGDRANASQRSQRTLAAGPRGAAIALQLPPASVSLLSVTLAS